MTSNQLKYNARSRRQLKKILRDSIRSYGPEVARKMADTFDTVFENVLLYPEMGRSREEFGLEIRSIPCGAFIVFYQYVGNTVRILAIKHHRQEVTEADFD